MKISIKWEAITYFNFTQSSLLRIMNKFLGEKIGDGNMLQGDNRKWRIAISDC